MSEGEKKPRRRGMISEEDKEFLKRKFGSVSKGIKALIEMYRRSLGPESPRLKAVYNALASASEATDYELKTGHAIEIICRELGCTVDTAHKYLLELLEGGYVRYSEKPGHVKVLPKRSITPQLWELLRR